MTVMLIWFLTKLSDSDSTSTCNSCEIDRSTLICVIIFSWSLWAYAAEGIDWLFEIHWYTFLVSKWVFKLNIIGADWNYSWRMFGIANDCQWKLNIYLFLQITLTHTEGGYFIPSDDHLMQIDDKQLKQMTSMVYVALISSCQYCGFRVKYGITKLPEQYHIGITSWGARLPYPAVQCVWELLDNIA